MKMRSFLFLVAAVFLSSIQSQAAVIRTWDGSSSGLWNLGANWTGGTVPAIGDDMIFPPNATRFNTTNDFFAGRTFGDITLSGSNYVLNGNNLILLTGISVSHVSGTSTINTDLGLVGDQFFNIVDNSSTLVINGDVAMTNLDLRIDGAGRLRWTGGLTGQGAAANVIMQGSGRVESHGTITFRSEIQVNGGEWWANGSALNPDFTVGATLRGVGTLGQVELVGGTIAPGTNQPGILAIRTNLTADSSSTFSFTLNGPVADTSHSQINIPTSAGTVSLGNATLDLSLGYIPAIGDSFTIINKAGTTNVTGIFSGRSEGSTFTVNGVTFRITYQGGTGNDVVLTVVSGTSTWSGVAGNQWLFAASWEDVLTPNHGYGLVFPATGVNRAMLNNIAVTNYNRITFLSSNYSISGGTLVATNGIEGNFPVGTNVINTAVTLNADQIFSNRFAGTLMLYTAVILNSNDLRLDGAGSHFTGPIVSGTNAVTKAGAGVWFMSGSNVFTGPTLLLAGTNILRNGDFAQSSGVVISNATLGGTGRVSGVTMKTASSRLEPGESPGRIIIAGNLVATNGAMEFDLNGTTAATQYDQLDVNGTVTLTNVNLSLSVGYAAAVGDSFVIIDNDGVDPVVGQFNSRPEGTLFTAGTNTVQVTYAGGDGNDVVLTIVPVLRVWDGSDATNNWSIANNWTGGIKPQPDDSLLFPFVASAADRIVTNDFPANTSFSVLTFSNVAYTVRGNAIDLREGLVALFNGSATIDAPLRLTTDQSWQLSNGNLTVSAAVNLNGNDLEVTGGLTGGLLTCSNGFTGSGILALRTPGRLALGGTNVFGTRLTNDRAALTLSGVLLNSSLYSTNATNTVAVGALVSNTPLTVITGAVVANGTFLRSALTATNALIQGTGTLGTVTMSGGRIDPAAFSTGVLSCSNVILSATTVLDLESSTNPTPGTGYDQLKVTGVVNLAGATLALSGNLPTNAGTAVIIVDNDGVDAITGTFAGYPEGFAFSVGLVNAHITYIGGTGNDVAIVVDSATTRGVWTGLAVSDLWSFDENWSGSVIPTTTDDVVFPEGALQKTNRNDQPRTFRSLNFAGSGYTLGAFTFDDTIKLSVGLFATNTSGSNIVQLPVEFLNASTVVSNVAGNVLTLTSVGTNVQQGDVNFNIIPVFDHSGTIRVSDINSDDTLVKRGLGMLVVTIGEQSANVVHSGTLRATNQSGLGFHFNGVSFVSGSVGISNAAMVEIGSDTYENLFTVAGTLLVLPASTVSVANPLTILGTNANLDAGDSSVLTLQSTVTAANTAQLRSVVGTNGTVIFNGAISTTNGYYKDGPGSVIFHGQKNYSGLTTVDGGALFIEGLRFDNIVEVNNNGSMSGFGVVGPLTCNSGFIAPGAVTTNSSLLATQGVNFSSLGALRVRLNGTSPLFYDQLHVVGPVVLGSPQLVTTLNFAPPIGSSFQVVSNDLADAFIGTFANLPQNGFHTNGQVVFRASYTGGSGNDFVITTDHYNTNATARVWTGAGANDLWTTPQNWTGNVVPQPGDPLVFPAVAARKSNTNNFPAHTAFQSITLGGPDYRLSGNALALVADVVATNATGTNTVALRLEVTGTNTIHSLNINATLVLEGGLDTNDRLGILAGSGRHLLTGPVVGGGSLHHLGPGLAESRGTNTYAGHTRVLGGRMDFVTATPGAGGGETVVTNGAIIAFRDGPSLNEHFLLYGRMIVSNNAGVTLDGRWSVPTNIGTLEISSPANVILRCAQMDGLGAMVKEGPGTLLLEDLGNFGVSNQFFGPVTSDTGAVLVRRTQFTNALTALNNATIGGTTTVGRIVVNAGVLAPGFPTNTPGSLVARGGVTLNPAATMVLQLNGVQAGLQYDQVRAEGVVNLSNATLRVTVGFSPVLGTPFQIISNDFSDAVIGTFNGLPEGAVIDTGGVFLRISYAGGDGNDVELTRVDPPNVIRPLVILTNGAARITGLGTPGGIYVIEAATNLIPPIAWGVIGADTADAGGLYEFTDAQATNHLMRFYRVQSP